MALKVFFYFGRIVINQTQDCVTMLIIEFQELKSDFKYNYLLNNTILVLIIFNHICSFES